MRRVLPAIIIAIIMVALIGGTAFWWRVGQKHAHYTTAIVTNGIECSEITRYSDFGISLFPTRVMIKIRFSIEFCSKIVKDGGSIADAAITALLCEGNLLSFVKDSSVLKL